jgi:hypothetical protein
LTLALEVGVLERFGESRSYRKWLKTWLELGQRILKMPAWMQDIVLEDVNTAIRNRVAVMEMIQEHAKRSH